MIPVPAVAERSINIAAESRLHRLFRYTLTPRNAGTLRKGLCVAAGFSQRMDVKLKNPDNFHD